MANSKKTIQKVQTDFWKKFQKIRHNNSLKKIEAKILLLWYYFRDPQTPLKNKAMIAGALLYLITPLDAIVDFTPFVGYVDDVSLLMWTYNKLKVELKNFEEKNQTHGSEAEEKSDDENL